MSNIWLITYLLCWLVAFYFYQRKTKRFDAESLVLLLYTIYAFVSFLLFNNTNYRYSFNPIHLFPFLYLFVMLWMAKSTIRQYCTSDIKIITNPGESLFLIVALFFVVPSLIHFPGSINNISRGITRLLMDSSEMNSMYAEALLKSEAFGTGGISNLSAIFSSAFYDIGALLTFYYFTLKKRNKLLSIALIMACLIGLLNSVSMGQRGAIVSRALTLAISFLILKPFYDNKTRRVIGVTSSVLAIGIIMLVGVMTVGRFESRSSGSLGSSMYYVGQANLYFNNYGLDDNGYRYGDRVSPLFKRMLGFSNVPHNFWERRDKYPHLIINDEVFCTFVGDFTIDYGPIIAFVLFVAFSVVFISATKGKNKTIHFHQLVLVHWTGCVCVQGGMTLFSMSDIGGNLEIIVYVLAYFLFKYSRKTDGLVVYNSCQ